MVWTTFEPRNYFEKHHHYEAECFLKVQYANWLLTYVLCCWVFKGSKRLLWTHTVVTLYQRQQHQPPRREPWLLCECVTQIDETIALIEPWYWYTLISSQPAWPVTAATTRDKRGERLCSPGGFLFCNNRKETEQRETRENQIKGHNHLRLFTKIYVSYCNTHIEHLQQQRTTSATTEDTEPHESKKFQMVEGFREKGDDLLRCTLFPLSVRSKDTCVHLRVFTCLDLLWSPPVVRSVP